MFIAVAVTCSTLAATTIKSSRSPLRLKQVEGAANNAGRDARQESDQRYKQSHADGYAAFIHSQRFIVRGRQHARINLNDDYAVRDWANKLGVSEDTRRAAAMRMLK